MRYSKIASLASLLFCAALLRAQPGSLDPNFGLNGRIITNIYPSDDQAFGAVRRSDGRLLVVGSATYDSVKSFAAWQFQPDGRLDPGFDLDGKLVRKPGPGTNIAYAVALYPDNRALLAGISDRGGATNDFTLMRLRPSGRQDTTFGNNGRVFTDFNNGDDFAYAVLLQPDGRIVAAGHTTPNGAISDFALARYMPNGALDSTFGNGGKVVHSISPWSEVIYDATLQPDGKIVGVGNMYDQSLAAYFAIARYLPNGAPDSTFGTNGAVLMNIGNAFDLARAVAVQPDGKIVVAGTSSVDFISQVSAVRLLPDGTLDSTFGVAGKVLVPVGALGSFCTDLVLMPDGRMLLSGMTEDVDHRDFHVLRLLPNGTLDPSFGTDGITTVSVSGNDDNSYALVLEPNGNFYLVGRSDNAKEADAAVLRFLPDGTLDPAFGQGGVVRADNGNSQDQARALLVLPNNRIIVGGDCRHEATVPFNINGFLVRYTASGALDTAFNHSGIVSNGLTSNEDRWSSLARLPNGALICAGRIDGNAGLAAYRADGTLKTDFGTAGLVRNLPLPTSLFNAMTLQADGKVLAAGQFNQPNGKNILMRFQSNGAPDSTFGALGQVALPLGGLADEWLDVGVQTGGRILAIGRIFTDTAAIGVAARFLPNGASDLAFGQNGLVLDPSPVGSNTNFQCMAFAPDGKIIIGGGVDDFTMTRLLPDGTRDTTFGPNGQAHFDYIGTPDRVNDIMVQADGRIVAAGTSFASSTTPLDNRFAVIRVNPDGQLDSTFGQNGMVHLRGIGATAIGQQTNGDIVTAGILNLAQAEGLTPLFQNDILLVRLITGPALGVLDNAEGPGALSVYPNPVRESLQLDYQLERGQRVSIRLFDENGREICTLIPGEYRPAGSHRESLLLPTGLIPGMYTLAVDTPAGRSALMIVKQ